MTLIQALILGIVQRLTEFLPVSSSAHLVLIPHLLGWNLTEAFIFPFDVLVQLGTLVAVVLYFREDLFEITASIFRGIRNRRPFEEAAARAGWLAILATIPAGLFGLIIKNKVEAAFNSPIATSVFLLVTAGLLIAAEYLGKRTRDIESLNWIDALWIGAFQALAVFPGISRSGSTITGAMTRDFKRNPAGQFSFILSIPIFLAAGALGIKDLIALPQLSTYLPSMLVGFAAAGLVGYFAIRWLLDYISSHSILPFAGYCIMLAVGSLAFSFLNPTVPVNANQPAPPSSNIRANTDPIFRVSIEPDLEWLLPVMVDCQLKQDSLAILFDQAVIKTALPADTAAFLVYGEIPGLGAEVFEIGNDTLVIGVNPGNSLLGLSADLTEAIFSGRVATWEQAVEFCPDCYSLPAITGPIDLYAFMPDSFLFETVQNSFLNKGPISTSARIAPDAKAMRQALSQDTQAIAPIPAGWVDDTIKIIGLDEIKAPSIPILAYVDSPLNDSLKIWLVCVQNSFK